MNLSLLLLISGFNCQVSVSLHTICEADEYELDDIYYGLPYAIFPIEWLLVFLLHNLLYDSADRQLIDNKQT